MPNPYQKVSSQGHQLLRWFLATVIMILVIFFFWVHRILLFVKPLAEVGLASAQYRLALEFKKQHREAVGSGVDYHDWLVRAAEQGHVEAMQQLIWNSRSREEKLHWLTKAAEGDMKEAQYQLGRQLMICGLKEHRRQGLAWIERAADGGYAEAQYLLVTGLERLAGIMRNDPARGVEILRAAAEQNHLLAMGALAMGYYKGRYSMNRDYRKAKYWYERLLKAYESGNYLGEISERFIPFQRQQLKYTIKALETEIRKVRKYEEASPLERQIIEIKEHYRIEFEKEVNNLNRGNGSPDRQGRTRIEINRLREKYNKLIEQEISRIKSQKEKKTGLNLDL